MTFSEAERAAAVIRATPIRSDASGVMPTARKMAEKLDLEPIPEIEAAHAPVYQFRRKDLWPPEVWEEMQAISRGERDAEPFARTIQPRKFTPGDEG